MKDEPALTPPAQPTQPNPPRSGWHVAWLAIRPRTLSLAVAPVVLGSALAWADGHAPRWLAFMAALACALLIQIGTNLHNDVADHLRGNDQPGRIGPLRVTAAGWVRPQTMQRASLGCLATALLLGTYLVAVGGWPILLAGVASLVAGWSYSGGPRPISHTAWGEVFVLVFFGLVAVAGSHWLQADATTPHAWLAGAVLGLPAAGVLLVNNYRDLDDDQRAGRRTLVARLGRDRARAAYGALMLLPFAGVAWMAMDGRPGAWLAMLLLPVMLRLVRRLGRQPPGAWLNGQLAGSAKAGAWLGLLLAVGAMW